MWTCLSTLPDTAGGPVVVTGYVYGSLPGWGQGYDARINLGDMPGYQSLPAYLPDLDLDPAVLCNEETPSVDVTLAAIHRVLQGP